MLVSAELAHLAGWQEVLVPVLLAWVGSAVTGAGPWDTARCGTRRREPSFCLYLCSADLISEVPLVPLFLPYRDLPQ